MSLTKAALFDKIKPRCEQVDVPGFGKVFIRTCPNLKFTSRWVSYADPATGEIIAEERAKSSIHELIDQVYVDEKTPMFSDDDFETLAEGDPERLAPLNDAVREFNNGDPKKTSA